MRRAVVSLRAWGSTVPPDNNVAQLSEHRRRGAGAGEPPKTQPVLDPAAPLVIAAAYLEACATDKSGRRLLHHWQSLFYRWGGAGYAALEEGQLRAGVYTFLANAWRPTKNGVEPFNVDRHKVTDVVDALRALCQLPPELTPPAWLGEVPADLAAGDIVALANTMLHLPSRVALPHTPDFFTLNALDFEYQPAADCPQWRKFLAEVLPQEAGDNTKEQLQQMAGYLLTADTAQQKAFILLGPPRSGKGTVGRIIERLVGPRNTVSRGIASLGATFGLEPLVGKRLALFSDVRLGWRTEQAPIVEFLLRVTGEDEITIPRKFLPAVSAHWPLRVVMLANELPPFFDPAGALISRFQVYQFPNSFLGSEDLALGDRLSGEIPGIFNWALDGLDALRAAGRFQQPTSAAQSLRHWQDGARPLSAFLREECVLGPPIDGDRMEVERSVLFAAWKTWRADNEMGGPVSRIDFGRQLHREARGIKESKSPRSTAPRLLLYSGIRLKTANEKNDREASDEA
jgi:putative DNA primase/helicase